MKAYLGDTTRARVMSAVKTKGVEFVFELEGESDVEKDREAKITLVLTPNASDEPVSLPLGAVADGEAEKRFNQRMEELKPILIDLRRIVGPDGTEYVWVQEQVIACGNNVEINDYRLPILERKELLDAMHAKGEDLFERYQIICETFIPDGPFSEGEQDLVVMIADVNKALAEARALPPRPTPTWWDVSLARPRRAEERQAPAPCRSLRGGAGQGQLQDGA